MRLRIHRGHRPQQVGCDAHARGGVVAPDLRDPAADQVVEGDLGVGPLAGPVDHQKIAFAVFTTIFVPGLYLSLMDIIALTDTTWSISKEQTTGIIFFILPLEEVLFFFITNVLIGFGMTLLLSKIGIKRFEDWKSNKYKGLP